MSECILLQAESKQPPGTVTLEIPGRSHYVFVVHGIERENYEILGNGKEIASEAALLSLGGRRCLCLPFGVYVCVCMCLEPRPRGKKAEQHQQKLTPGRKSKRAALLGVT